MSTTGFIRKKINNTDTAIVATFGEIMLRLSPPGFMKFFQTPSLNANFGGGEANVAVSLAIHGQPVRFISMLPDNEIGQAAERRLMGFGVDTSFIIMKKDSRMGIYFVEKGADQRPSNVIYDRYDSAINYLSGNDIYWDRAFESCAWFHITGITPSLSRNAADNTITALRIAGEKGCIVSCDLNFRKKLWNYGVSAPDLMPEIIKHSDIVIANEEDCQQSLGIQFESGISSGKLDRESYKGLAEKVMHSFSSLKLVAITLRESISASNNRWSACCFNGKDFLLSKVYDINNIVDRVGSGDSFTAGLIYGLLHFDSDQDALEYATAASCLKHSIEGDFNLSTRDDIERLMFGDETGRINR